MKSHLTRIDLQIFPLTAPTACCEISLNYISTWIFENQVPPSKRVGVCYSLFFALPKLCLKFTISKQNATASLVFFSYSRFISLFSLLSEISGCSRLQRGLFEFVLVKGCNFHYFTKTNLNKPFTFTSARVHGRHILIEIQHPGEIAFSQNCCIYQCPTNTAVDIVEFTFPNWLQCNFTRSLLSPQPSCFNGY